MGSTPEATEPRPYATRIDRFLAPYVHEPGLLPITLVLVAHVVLAIAVSLIDTWRSGAGFAVLGLFVMGLITIAAWISDWRNRRVGIVGGTWILCWPLGVLCAVLAERWELY